jgi:hypothetical protein
VLLRARILIYIDGLLSVAQTVAVAILPSSIFPNVQLLVKRLAGSGLKLIEPAHANKVLLKVAHAFLYIDGLLSVTKLCPSRCYLTFFHFPERSIALVKRLAGSQKG